MRVRSKILIIIVALILLGVVSAFLYYHLYLSDIRQFIVDFYTTLAVNSAKAENECIEGHNAILEVLTNKEIKSEDVPRKIESESLKHFYLSKEIAEKNKTQIEQQRDISQYTKEIKLLLIKSMEKQIECVDSYIIYVKSFRYVGENRFISNNEKLDQAGALGKISLEYILEAGKKVKTLYEKYDFILSTSDKNEISKAKEEIDDLFEKK